MIRLRRKKILGASLVAVAAVSLAGAALLMRDAPAERIAAAMTGGNPSAAPELIRRYGCAGCHAVSGIAGGDGLVGGSLNGIKSRVYIAGVALNSPDNLIKWIVAPRTFSPRTAMPASGITESEARDVAAYLYAR